MQNRMLRAVAAIAVSGLVAACATAVSPPVAVKDPTPVAAETTAPATTAAPAASDVRHVVVRPGQSVSRVAAEYGVSRRAIIEANHLTPPYKIETGKRLLIPGSAEAPPAPVASEARHIVVPPGRSVSRIAARYGVSERAIIDANHLTPPYKIKTGQDLLIPGSAEAPPASVALASPPPAINPVGVPESPKATALAPAAASPAGTPAAEAVTGPPPPGAGAAPSPLPPVAEAANPPLPAAAASPPPPPQPSVVEQAPAASAAKPIGAVATAGAGNPPVSAEPLPAPAVPAPAPAPMATDTPPVPARSAAPNAAAATPPPTQTAVPATAPPGVTCPPGTVGMSSVDVTKKPVFICHRIGAPG